ncbi:MAG: lysylphosphatidylglycerol synthase transmembrane domain-containing protein [Tepidiformaceae bacterium]
MHSLLHSRRLWLQAVLLAGMAALVAWRADLAEAWDVFTSIAPGYALLGVGLLIASNVVHAKKWQHLLAGVGDVPLRDSFAVFWASMAANNLIPLRAGDVLRVQVMSQRTGMRRGGIVASLFTESLLDGVAFIVLIAAALAIQGRTSDFNLWVLVALLLFVGIVAATIAAARSKPGPEIERAPLLRLVPSRFRRSVADFIPHAIDGLRPLGEARSGISVTALALIAWLLEAGAYIAWGEAFRLEAGPTALLLVMVAVNVAGSITILPANLGLYELTAVGVLRAAGEGPSEATAYAIGTHLLVIATIAIIGLGTMLYLRLSPADIFYFRQRAEESAESPAPETARGG